MSVSQQLVKKLQMNPHPEGGYYKETYRADGTFETNRGVRNYSTQIYYLLEKGDRSRFHRLLLSDEVFHFYLGGPLQLVEIDPQGNVRKTLIGSDILNGQKAQHVISAGNWFGCLPAEGSDFCLIGCSVAPGFDFSDFEIGNHANLVQAYPHAKVMIDLLADS